MRDETIGRLEKKIRKHDALTESDRAELLKMMASLTQEVDLLSETHGEQAESISRFAELSTLEATRTEKNQHLSELALDGFSSSVKEFEASHPKLVQIVNSICGMLSNIGI